MDLRPIGRHSSAAHVLIGIINTELEMTIQEYKNVAMDSILGEQLSSVEFVQDYVQFRFDGPTLTAFTLPQLKYENRIVLWSDVEFKNFLCAQISQLVSKTIIQPEESLTIVFENSVELWISLRDQDYTGPEAVMFQYGDQWWVL